MFDWLTQEIVSIKSRKFHLIEGSASDELRAAVVSSPVPLPASYKEFVLRFGNAKLYRQGGVYLVQIWAVPNKALGEEGERILEFGRTDSGVAYFNEALLVPGSESPVFLWRGSGTGRKDAEGFEDWLFQSCQNARSMFSKKQWEGILKGPSPFSAAEKSVLDARKKFRWRVIGTAPNGDILFEVHNASEMVLPYLSVGVRGKNGKVDGGVWLPTSSIKPGETKILQKGCYKNVLSPNDVEAFELPDPEPEDRDRFWEFNYLRSHP